MENRLHYINLYDIYSNLLTEKQKIYFEDYYFSNLSLSEISENLRISRNAVHKQIKETEEKLDDYENKLHIYEKNKKIKEILQSFDQNIQKQIEEIL